MSILPRSRTCPTLVQIVPHSSRDASAPQSSSPLALASTKTYLPVKGCFHPHPASALVCANGSSCRNNRKRAWSGKSTISLIHIFPFTPSTGTTAVSLTLSWPPQLVDRLLDTIRARPDKHRVIFEYLPSPIHYRIAQTPVARLALIDIICAVQAAVYDGMEEDPIEVLVESGVLIRARTEYDRWSWAPSAEWVRDGGKHCIVDIYLEEYVTRPTCYMCETTRIASHT